MQITEGRTSYYCLQRSWGKVIFSEACVKNSVHRRGCAWQGACVAGGWGGGVCGVTGGHELNWATACVIWLFPYLMILGHS